MSIALFAVVASGCLVAFALLNRGLAQQPWLAVGLVSLLLMSLAGIGAMLLTYSSEVYPTALRSTGAGLGAGATKAGGIVGPPLVGLLLVADRSGAVAALAVAAPITMAAALLWRMGIETRGRALESISASRQGDPAPVPIPVSAGEVGPAHQD
jgi:putative MFS transporter